MSKHDDLTRGDDARLSRNAGNGLKDAPARADRAADDRAATQDREITDEDRLEMFRMAFFNDQLPVMPPIEGFHYCWLTTTNPRDTVQARLRLGYELVKAADVRGYEQLAVKDGAYAGCVMINEMILGKLPNRLYQMYMTEVHHNQPLSEEGKIRAALEQMGDAAKSKKGKLILEEGMQEFFNAPPEIPDFLTEPDPPSTTRGG